MRSPEWKEGVSLLADSLMALYFTMLSFKSNSELNSILSYGIAQLKYSSGDLFLLSIWLGTSIGNF